MCRMAYWCTHIGYLFSNAFYTGKMSITSVKWFLAITSIFMELFFGIELFCSQSYAKIANDVLTVYATRNYWPVELCGQSSKSNTRAGERKLFPETCQSTEAILYPENNHSYTSRSSWARVSFRTIICKRHKRQRFIECLYYHYIVSVGPWYSRSGEERFGRSSVTHDTEWFKLYQS